MSKIKPSTVHALQRRHTPNGAVQAMTQIVDFEAVNDGDSVYIMYWYSNGDAPLAEAAGANFVPIPTTESISTPTIRFFSIGSSPARFGTKW